MSETELFYGEKRSWVKAMARGFTRKCPSCGEGAIFSGYTTTHPACGTCGLDFTNHNADDAPPYFTIMVVGHIIIPLALTVQRFFDLSLTLQFAIWLPVLIISTYLFLPRSKGALIGLQWANRMHGFDKEGIGKKDSQSPVEKREYEPHSPS